MNLDDFGVFNRNNEMETPLILNDAHAMYVYEHFSICGILERQIEDKLAEERQLEEEKLLNYIRIGE